MKFIFSRKGIDSAAGGFANPILTDGTLLSLPIPDDSTSIRYSDLTYNDKTYCQMISELKGNVIKLEKNKIDFNINTRCHFDPDIRKEAYPRTNEWKGIFGQMGAAQSHLDNKNVEIGDVFLFFGWFRKTIEMNGKLAFDPTDKHGRHIIYGYMEIGEIIKADDASKIEPWMKYHPHADEAHLNGTGNTIYLSSGRLSLDERLNGFGVFDYSDDLVLTMPGCSRSKWDLPEFFKNVKMSYHTEKSWKEDYFKSTDRGQEFVIEESACVTEWAKQIIVDHSNCSNSATGIDYIDVPVKNIINKAKADGVMDALNVIKDSVMSYLDDNGIKPEEVDPHVKKVVGIVFKNIIDFKDKYERTLEETDGFDFDIEDINVRVPKDRVIRDECRE